MTDRRALLAAICATDCKTADEKRARWSDDAPRLVYADWLEENAGDVLACDGSGRHSHPGKAGTVIHGILHEFDPRKAHHHHDEKCRRIPNGFAERAEFIRVQCELARREAAHLPVDDPCTCTRDKSSQYYKTGEYCGACQRRSVPLIALRRREQALREGPFGQGGTNYYKWGKEALGELYDQFYYEFARGFIEWIECTAADWLTHGDAIVKEHPVTTVKLTTWPIGLNVHPVVWGQGRTDEDATMDALAWRWPGITFHLPEQREREWYVRYVGIDRMAWEDEELTVHLRSGGVIRYPSVPRDVYLDIVNAASPGRALHQFQVERRATARAARSLAR